MATLGIWSVAVLALISGQSARAYSIGANVTNDPGEFGSGPVPPSFGAQLHRAPLSPLRTSGRYIVNNRGERVKWACISWYGAYSTTHAVGGLEVRPMDEIVDRIVELGFNCVRMMYSTQGYVDNPLIEDHVVAANPDLRGKRFLEVFDRTIEAMTNKGLMVILNNHNSKSGWCCHYSQDEGLWYVPEFTEEQWIESLVFFAARYRNNKMVVAIDLRNEVHDYQDTHLDWGSGNRETDWAAAAVRAGNAVLTVNPDALIVVMAMCFGMDLRLMKDLPLQMMYPNRIVYQTHNYLEFQVFDNVAKMFAPWHVIRGRLLLGIISLVCLLSTLLYGWVQVGKPRPPRGLVSMSFGVWFLIYFTLAGIAAYQVYKFGMLFCAVAMESDVVPWIRGSIVAAIVSTLAILNGARRMCIPKRAPSTVPTVSRCSSAADGVVDVDSWLDVEKVASEREPVSGASCSTDDAGETPASASASAPETAADQRGCASGCPGGRFASLARARVALAFDVDRLVRRVLRWLGFQVSSPSKREAKPETSPTPWDLGMLLALQLGIVALIALLTLLVGYVFAHIIPTYWWLERHLDGLWGFALEEGHAYTAPIWMGEFGGNVRGQWWLNFVRYLSIRDVDWAVWALNGKKWAEGYIDGGSGNFVNYDQPRWDDETFGVLQADYFTVRHPWKLLDLQGLMASPATWRPDARPCSWNLDPSCMT